MSFLSRLTLPVLTVIALNILLSNSLLAVPPSPEAKEKWINEGIWKEKMNNLTAFKAQGGCAPAAHLFHDASKFRKNMAQGVQVVDTINVILILVDFTDNTWPSGGAAVTPTMFDSLLFSDRDTDPVHMPTGSMHDFYLENSYGQFYIKGQVFGWFRAPNTYAFYEGGNDGLNSRVQGLVRDCVLMADSAGANFADFDVDGDGFCDGVLVAHAGPGAETGAFGIWSHAWTIPSPLTLDGVVVSNYNINPEESSGGGPSTIGVFCHEYGHFLGIPDLYNTNDGFPNGDGLGDWSLMSGGSWNGGGARPSHFDAYSKDFLGFANVIDVTENLKNVAFPAVEHNPVIYRLSNGVSQPFEFWYVENRQKMGFDITMPGSGLLVFHVDFSVEGSNSNPDHWFVGLEQADGNFDLEYTSAGSDAGDPYPGSTNSREFHDQTVPSPSLNVFMTPTSMGIWNISDNDSIIYADLDIEWSRPYVVLSGLDSLNFDDPLPLGDDDGDLDPGETVDFYCSVKSLMLTSYNPIASLSTTNPDVTILVNDVPLDDDLASTPVSNSGNPIQLLIDDSVDAVIDTFVLTITSDSLPSTPGSGEFVKTITFTYAIGSPRILFVDDDRGAATDELFSGVFDKASKPYKIWRKNTQGIPSGTELDNYPMVFWSTGDSAANVLNASDVASMKHYLDNGGSLFLSTTSGIQTMKNVDSVFMRDYFKARYDGTSTQLNIRGVAGSVLGDDTQYKAPLIAPFDNSRQTMSVVSGGETFLSYTFGSPTPAAGISYDGAYRTVLISFPMESIQDNVGGTWWPKDTLIDRVFFWLFDSPDSTNARTILSLDVVGEAGNNVISHTPQLEWTAQLGYPGDFQSKFQIQVGSDNNWVSAEMWDTGEISGAQDTATYAGAALIDGATYYTRVRVENGFVWSEWYESTFRMNTPPNPPVPLRPVSDALTPVKPKLYVANAVDPDGDLSLHYIFEIYSDSNLTAIVATDSFVTQASDSTSWISDVTLAYDTRYWWRSKASDSYELSVYSAAASLKIQNVPQAPSAPSALTPYDTGAWPLFYLLPTFDWTNATDPNPFDSLTYRLRIGQDSLFVTATNYNNIPSSEYTLTTPLLYNKRYWWRVTAHDNTGLASIPSNTRSFWTWTLGDVNHSHSSDILDLNFMVNRLFRSGPAPNPDFVGDFNGDCDVNIVDLNYIVNRIFRGGPAPVPGC
ncbi:MAG TPA: M6 family metalloprotease domain-containing protein [candidate division Zixibacteria bacterium]|nr:M6 family metalloprotease domain-containing protein [candidate division Zixibacteria bacterium]